MNIHKYISKKENHNFSFRLRTFDKKEELLLLEEKKILNKLKQYMNIKQFITDTEAKINSVVEKVETWITNEEHSVEQAIINEISKLQADFKLEQWKQKLQKLQEKR